MKISLCMITKDEEKSLPSCLQSVKNHVDEMIIVDTGSTDNTCHIALEYGTKIFHLKWKDDFSEARNFALEKAKGDWILFLDADEVLENGELLRPLVEKADHDLTGFLFHILNYSDEKLTQIERSHSLRLFRNTPDLRFFGAIHEQLPVQDKMVAMTDLVIHHYGYLPSITKAKEKSKRNLNILEKEMRRDPNNPFLYYNLGMEYTRVHNYEHAQSYFKKALELIDGETGYESRLYKMMAISYLTTKKCEEGISTISSGIEKFPDYPDLYYLRGLCYEASGDLLKATADFLYCLTMHNQPFRHNRIYAVEEGITDKKSFNALDRLNEKMDTHYFVQVHEKQEFLENIHKAITVLIEMDYTFLSKAIEKFPVSKALQTEYQHIQKVIQHVKAMAAP